MTRPLAPEVERHLAAGEPVVLVTVTGARGSTPRAAGARMAVAASAVHGTIGGGRMEFEAIQRARDMIADDAAADTIDMPLGPAVGQCCGGRVVLGLSRADASALAALAAAEERERQQAPRIMVFGAGHVGKALVRSLEPLPLRVTWSDARRNEFPASIGDNVEVDVSDPVDAVRRASKAAAVVVVTHSHALDFAITEAALLRGDLAYVGLIGSRTKRRRFERWFTARGGSTASLGRLVSPIGDFGVADKRPEVIAALAAAELLRALARQVARDGAAAHERQREEAV